MSTRLSGACVRVLALAVILAALRPSGAEAEKGALTVETGIGGGLAALPTPLTRPPAELRPVLMPSASLAARWSFSHRLALGVAIHGEPRRWLVHEDAAVEDGGGPPLVGRLGHFYSSLALSTTARFYLAGFDWRLFMEPRAGWSRRFYADVEHLRVLPGGGLQSYGLEVEPFTLDSLLVGLGLGLEHVWDRAALGARLEGTALLMGEPVWQGGLVVYAAYDFYP